MVATTAPDRNRVRTDPRVQIQPEPRPDAVRTVQETPAERVRADAADQQSARRGALAADQAAAQRFQATSASAPILRRNARGAAVEDLQRLLNERGATPALEVDGRFGPRTDAAVRAYQAANPPLQVDGIVGPRTRASLARPASETNPIGTPGSGGTQGSGATDAATLNNMDPRRMTAQQAAQALLNSRNVSFWGGLSTGSDRRQLERIANGENPRVPVHGNREVTPNVNMLRALVQMSREGRIQINALTGGSHSTNSNHYRGDSVDMQPGVGLSTARIRQIAAQYGGVKNNEAHIHLTFPR